MAALTNRYEDDDARHLPFGMTRVGYDTDTERYTFRHGDSLWLGEPGSLYGGKMKWAGKVEDDSTGHLFSKDDDNSESEEDPDYDSDGFSYSEDKKLVNTYATHRKPAMQSLSYTPTSSNEWGVPVTSMSSTDARPPDSAHNRRNSLFKKAAVSAVFAIGMTRQLSIRRKGKTAAQCNNNDDEGEKMRKVSPGIKSKQQGVVLDEKHQVRL